MENLIVLSRLIQLNPNYKNLTIQGGTLQLGQNKINISNLDLNEVITRHNIIENINKISVEEFFNICLFCADNTYAMFKLAELNENYKKLIITNNTLILNGRKINVSNLCLGNLIERNDILNHINEISVEDFFEICYLHANKNYIFNIKETVFQSLNTNNKNPKEIIEFNKYIFKIIEYYNYLDEDIKDLYQKFSEYITELQTNPNINEAQKQEVEAFYQALDKNEERRKAKKDGLNLTLKPEITTNGYINIFLITILTIASGITLGAIIFLKLGI